MKTYSISEVAKELNLTAYTLRYYDKEGLMPFVERTTSGKRVFKESDISFLKIRILLKISTVFLNILRLSKPPDN